MKSEEVQFFQFPWVLRKRYIFLIRSHFPDKNHHDNTTTKYNSIHTLQRMIKYGRV